MVYSQYNEGHKISKLLPMEKPRILVKNGPISELHGPVVSEFLTHRHCEI